MIILLALGIRFSKFPDAEEAVRIFSQYDTPRIKIISCFGLNRIEIIGNTNATNPPAVVLRGKQIVSEIEKQIVEIRATQVGFFHLTFETKGKPFIELGQRIKKGDDVGLIMCNLLHTADRVKSEVSGTVVEINLEDGMPVEFDQLLMKIETK